MEKEENLNRSVSFCSTAATKLENCSASKGNFHASRFRKVFQASTSPLSICDPLISISFFFLLLGEASNKDVLHAGNQESYAVKCCFLFQGFALPATSFIARRSL
ncbi:MAG: hypothetical protein ACFB10_23650, partial [Salibacteraceae bacterium]